MDTNRETAEAFWEALARREFDSATTALHPSARRFEAADWRTGIVERIPD
jgi:hypothetical protein